jgi:hypothetical protein
MWFLHLHPVHTPNPWQPPPPDVYILLSYFLCIVTSLISTITLCFLLLRSTNCPSCPPVSGRVINCVTHTRGMSHSPSHGRYPCWIRYPPGPRSVRLHFQHTRIAFNASPSFPCLLSFFTFLYFYVLYVTLNSFLVCFCFLCLVPASFIFF